MRPGQTGAGGGGRGGEGRGEGGGAVAKRIEGSIPLPLLPLSFELIIPPRLPGHEISLTHARRGPVLRFVQSTVADDRIKLIVICDIEPVGSKPWIE